VLLGLAAELVVRELVAPIAVGATVGYGAGLLLLCELVAWAETLRSPAVVERAVVGRRVLHLAALAALAAAVSGVALAGGSISSANAFLAGLAGAAAVVALLALVRSLGRDEPRPAVFNLEQE
jgi:hypothetical protein